MRPRLPTRGSLRAAATLVVIVATMSGCSGDRGLGQPMAAEVTADACDLLDPEAISAATGWALPAGTLADEQRRDRSVCSTIEPRHHGLVQVQLYPADGARSAAAASAELADAGIASHPIELAGVDTAVLAPDHGVVGLQVGDTFVQVVTVGPGIGATAPVDVAAAIAERLP